MKRIWQFLKIVLVTLPLVYVISKIDMPTFTEQLSSVPIKLVVLAGSILLVRISFQSWRFSILTRPFTSDLGFLRILAADLKAKYLSLIIPSSVGQDIVRGTLLKNHLTPDETVGISLVFRLTGLLPFLFLSSVGLFYLAGFSEIQEILPLLFTMATLLILFTAVLFSKRLSRAIGKLVQPILPAKVLSFSKQTISAVQLYRGHGKLSLLNLVVSFCTQLLIVGFSSVLLKAITGEFHFATAITFIPVIEIIAVLIPFAPSGFGARETGYVLMFNKLGESDESRALYIWLALMMYLVNLTGIIVIIGEKIIQYKRKDKHGE